MQLFHLAIAIGSFLAAAHGPKVYYGSVDGAKKPAELVAQKVYDEIPEYQEIKKRGLSPDDPEYWVLMAKATKKFYAAVEKIAKRDDYDCVVESGTHDFENPPDITQTVIGALEK